MYHVYCPGQLRNCCGIVNLDDEKGAKMRFFEKLFGSVPNSDEKNDYARATLKFAMSHEINTTNAIADNNNRRWAYNNQVKYAKVFEDVRKAQSLGQQVHLESTFFVWLREEMDMMIE